MSEHHPLQSREEFQLPIQTPEVEAPAWDRWVTALYEWHERCDSTKCTVENQAALHAQSRAWAGRKGGPVWIWFETMAGKPQNWGRIAWCLTEESFVGRLEAKHRMFERAASAEGANVVAQVHEYLRKGCIWALMRRSGRETKGADVSISLDGTPSDCGSDDAVHEPYLGFLERAYDPDLKPSREADVPEGEIRRRLVEAQALEDLCRSLETSHWALLLLFMRDIRLNNPAFRPEDWKAVELPAGQAQRYARKSQLMDLIQQRVLEISRTSLCTLIQMPEEVDPLEVRVASRILLQGLLERVKNKFFPEDFQHAVFKAVGQDALT